MFRSQAYSPDQRNVFPGTRCTPSASILRSFQNSNSDCGKIIADYSDEIDRRKKTRADRGVGSGAAEQIGVFLDRGLDGIERNGTNNENGHDLFLIADC